MSPSDRASPPLSRPSGRSCTGPDAAGEKESSMAKTVLAIGAHYDDCVFGIPGILLQAVRKHHRVVILSLIGDYTNWSPVKGREKEFVQGTVQVSKEYGAEMRFLTHASMGYDVN